MNQIVEIKRKEYEIIESIGSHSFKVMRKNQYFFMKKYEDDPAGFEKFIEAEHRLRVSGVTNPKCFLYDKKTRTVIVEYVEGKNCLQNLLEGDLPESIIELMFKTFWYARNDRLALDYSPENFVFANNKLYYLPFICGQFTTNEQFIQKDIRLWFFTKEFVKYCRDRGLTPDESRLKSDYETNKNIALMTVKYYR